MADDQCTHPVCGWLCDGRCHIDDPDLPQQVIAARVPPDEILRVARTLIAEPGTNESQKKDLAEVIAMLEKRLHSP